MATYFELQLANLKFIKTCLRQWKLVPLSAECSSIYCFTQFWNYIITHITNASLLSSLIQLHAYEPCISYNTTRAWCFHNLNGRNILLGVSLNEPKKALVKQKFNSQTSFYKYFLCGLKAGFGHISNPDEMLFFVSLIAPELKLVLNSCVNPVIMELEHVRLPSRRRSQISVGLTW